MGMSYSQKVKKEICEAKLTCENCEKALLYGMLLFGKSIKKEKIFFNTENKAAADLFIRAVINLSGAIVTVTEPDLRNRIIRPLYLVSIDDRNDVEKIRSFFFEDSLDGVWNINPFFLKKDCCKIAFLRGVYLACGTMTNPEKEYHLEFSVFDNTLCSQLNDILLGFDLHFHRTMRLKNSILYIKESEELADMLARLGAVKSSLELINLKIVKELRNKVNRVTNCETANIGKTVNASIEQIKKIKIIQETIGFETLSPKLKEAAELRISNPDLSLRELCELTRGKITRSGLNHRLQKLCEIADKLK